MGCPENHHKILLSYKIKKTKVKINKWLSDNLLSPFPFLYEWKINQAQMFRNIYPSPADILKHGGKVCRRKYPFPSNEALNNSHKLLIFQRNLLPKTSS